MIKVDNLQKVYQTNGKSIVALENIDLEITQGEIFGIIGYSGAGKSTLIRCFNMLETPTSGNIIIDNQDITRLSTTQLREKRKEIGMIFQHFNLLSARTVRGNIAYPLEIAGMKKADINKRVDELIHLVGLTNQADSYPAQLSGGQKQRVGIARAIANNPKVLLCDEATSALDPKTTLSILELLKDINRRLGLTMVLITHEMEVIKNICDRVAVIDQGQIAELGTVLQLFSQPKTKIAHEFLKQVTHVEVPEEILANFASKDSATHKLLQLSFLGETTSNPVISDMIKTHDIDINILHGQINRIQDTPYGTLVMTVEGAPENISNALKYLKENNIRIEVLTNGL
ncbi:methionine ABC transporter ATP-binding protein [Desulfuribacillus alkaliarsenatis]|uniref:Methionine ABC transporter ATP-binding protein n=1 Tax=Desulfuribacillus alkaliarsenatis TaxID=766136 RepID=A0A1E5G6C2_9FIRM|nr:methionine ABC transporter ATP-binding protein [Desulfuribacillus alkaliarsenatis]